MAKKRRTVHPSVVMQSRFGDEHLELIGVIGTAVLEGLTLLEPQSRFGNKLLGIRVVCPQNGTAFLKGLSGVAGALSSFDTPTAPLLPLRTPLLTAVRVLLVTWYVVCV